MAINLTNAAGAGSQFNQLAPWQVHKVFITEISHESKEDKNGKPYHSVKITFGNDNGDFSQSFFCPVGAEEMKEGGKRTLSKENSYEQPSKEEMFVFQILHVCSAGGEEVENRFKTFYAKVDPTVSIEKFEHFCEQFEKFIKKSFIDTKKELQLKLHGNKEGYATIPFCVGITKKGDAYISKPWLVPADARPLTFSAKDLAAKAKYESMDAKGATKMDDDDFDTKARSAVKDDLDDFNTDEI